MYTEKFGTKITYEGGRERATSADDCQRVSVQQYSVQCKGYNLIGVTTVEASETRGTTREKKEIERKPSTDFEILLMTDG